MQFSEVYIKYFKNNVYSCIEIKNFGNPIDEKDLPHIFERFFKGKNSSLESIGIGLALSKNIIEKDNGTILVQSQYDYTNFIIKYFDL